MVGPTAVSHNGSTKPDARREARVPKAKARSAAAGFVCYAALLAAPVFVLLLTCRGSSEIAMQSIVDAAPSSCWALERQT
jgi:hypothetical protein